jgi:hypothetical protein
VEFGADNCDLSGGIDAESNAIASYPQHRDSNTVADMHLFAGLSAED